MSDTNIYMVLCSVPASNLDSPLVGTVLLSSILRKHNFSTKLFDFNIDLYHRRVFDNLEWEEIQHIFATEDKFNNILPFINQIIDEWVSSILQLFPKFIGFGIFTKSNSFITKKLCEKIREKDKNVKLIIGGLYTDVVGEEYLNQGIIDYYVIGAAEQAILDIANNTTENVAGINGGITEPVAFENFPFPDYTEVDLSLYKSKALYITGSRSCPYKCTFCSVPRRWPKYQLRNIDDILSEIQFHITTKQVYSFNFTDSLVNGDMRFFRKLCIALSELKSDKKIKINLFMSVRNQFNMPPSDFDLLAKANIGVVKIGVESGSENVLNHIKKNYKPKDLIYFLEQLQRVNVKCDLLFIAGYPTETEEDFEMSIQLLHTLLRFKNIISYIRVVPLSVEYGTPLADMGYELGTTEIGIKRYKLFREQIFKLGYEIRQDKLMSTLILKNPENKI